VREVMCRPVVVLPPEARVAQVFAEADAKRVHHFPILDGEKVVGFVCTCDLIHAQADEPVLPLAWRHPASVSPTCTVTDAARLLLMHGVGSLLVMSPGGLRGIITADDLREVGPDLAALLEPARCTVCRAGEHLRPGPDGRPICAYCKAKQARAVAD
jgi:CBS domain-containing protein